MRKKHERARERARILLEQERRQRELDPAYRRGQRAPRGLIAQQKRALSLAGSAGPADFAGEPNDRPRVAELLLRSGHTVDQGREYVARVVATTPDFELDYWRRPECQLAWNPTGGPDRCKVCRSRPGMANSCASTDPGYVRRVRGFSDWADALLPSGGGPDRPLPRREELQLLLDLAGGSSALRHVPHLYSMLLTLDRHRPAYERFAQRALVGLRREEALQVGASPTAWKLARSALAASGRTIKPAREAAGGAAGAAADA